MKYLLIIILALLGSTSIAAAEEEGAVVVQTLTKSTTSWDGNQLPAYPPGSPEVTILRFSIPGNTTLSWHFHPVINAGVMISGKLTVITKDGDTLHLNAGDPIVETVDTWHQGINEYSEPVDLIVFYAGVVDGDLTILEE